MKTCILLAAFAAASYAQLLPGGLPAPSSSAPVGEVKPDTVVAVIAGVSVTAGDVAKVMKYASPNLVQVFKQNPQQALGTAYQMKYLADEAKKEHLDEKDPTKEDLEAVLAMQTEITLANAMVNEINNGYQVTESQIKEFYNTHQSRWEEATIKIILIGFKPAPVAGAIKEGQSVDEAVKQAATSAVNAENALNQRSEAEAEKLANDIVKQLRAGADFGTMVAKYSDDKESKAAGGDFGVPFKANSSFAPEIKKVVFSLKPGEVSDPLRQANSFYIIRAETRTVQPLDGDVTASIVQELRNQHMHDTLNDLNQRFTPQVLRPDFFIQMQQRLNGN